MIPNDVDCVAGSATATSCGPNANTATNASTTVSQCRCSAGYFGTNGACTICPIGTYCALASTTSTSCGANTYTATNGSTTQSQCLCKAGYFGSNGACAVCPPGSFCIAGGSTAASCGPNTYTANNGSTAQSQCLCNAGYYGTNGACTICPRRSFCPQGSAQAQTCGFHADTARSQSISASDCLCESGYFGANGTCRICPESHYCPLGSTEAFSCGPDAFTNSPGVISAVDCLCNAGLFGSDGACQVCPKGSYCPEGATVSTACANGETTRAEGSSSASACVLLSTLDTTEQGNPNNTNEPPPPPPSDKFDYGLSLYFFLGASMSTLALFVSITTCALALRNRVLASLEKKEREELLKHMQPPTTVKPQSMKRQKPVNLQSTYGMVTTNSALSNGSKSVSINCSVHARPIGESTISTMNKTIVHGNYAYANSFSNIITYAGGDAAGTTSSLQNKQAVGMSSGYPIGGGGGPSPLRSDPFVGPEKKPVK